MSQYGFSSLTRIANPDPTESGSDQIRIQPNPDPSESGPDQIRDFYQDPILSESLDSKVLTNGKKKL